jgi:hypothetical protein
MTSKRSYGSLTDELRHLREELRSMVAPPKPNPTRAFLHRHLAASRESAPPRRTHEAPDKPRRRRKPKPDGSR